MSDSSVRTARVFNLYDASRALTQCLTLAEAIACMESAIRPLVDPRSFDIVWCGRGQAYSLRSPISPLPTPSESSQHELAGGQPVTEQGCRFVPMLAQGVLQGWISVPTDYELEETLAIWANHCGATLLAFGASGADGAPDQPPGALDEAERHRQLSEVVEIGNVLRSTFRLQELADRIVQTMRSLTGTGRAMLGLVDGEQREVRIASSIGLDVEVKGRDSQQLVTLNDLEKLLAEAKPLGTFTYQVGRTHSLPEFDDAVFLAIRDPRGALVGVMVLDAAPPTQSLTAEHIGNIEIIANQSGIALSNALLYTEQQRVVDRLTALNALSLAVSTTQLSADIAINMAIAGAVGTTNAEGGAAAVILEGRPLTLYGSRPLLELDPQSLSRLVPEGADYIEVTHEHLPESLVRSGISMVLFIPMRGATLTVGSFWIGYREATLRQAERELAVLYGKMAGAVLENLYLDEVVRNAHDRMASVLGSTREGMLLVGGDRRVSIANRAFAEILNLDASQLQRRQLSDLCEDAELLRGSPEFRTRICDALAHVLDGEVDIAEGEASLLAGTERDLSWWVVPVPDVGGGSTGALLVIRDVTAEREMERLRQDLSNMIVHDLRAPLTNIMVSVDLLLKQGAGALTETQGRILAIASASCQQMLDLVNALLDIRRLQQRKVELERQPVYLEILAEMVLERLEASTENKRIHLAVNLEGTPAVMVDADMVRRVLQNLVDNAVKFSRPGSMVEVTSKVMPDAEAPDGHAPGKWVRVEVRDEGPGIPDEYHQLIFEVFAQAPGGYGRGTGLGLAFCKLAVEAHGGRIWVESVLEQGSSFYFTLPLAY